MTYQVLARKWRPANFAEMVGQEHVLHALINALNQQRLHHAYLFTGTRGVGKTTIARILAKCLNCETGVSAEPCGTCAACEEISAGRFVDLIEVDAASRTKVEDTRELLENVQYAPTRGRYKVYLIDEVHMLSSHSFNALLKTLEEPPEHVKFVLATTDPQKLPVTILSRCLQFNLKSMTAELIAQHLETILNAESVDFEAAALPLLGRAAKGSMRDALSLTDQAVGYGSGSISESGVSEMLGTIDQQFITQIVTALAEQNGKALLASTQRIAEMGIDYNGVLEELLSALHKIALTQAVPDALASIPDHLNWQQFAESMTAEDVQLYYQLGLNGRRDLPLAPDPRVGLEMVLLRMLAFRPAQGAELTAASQVADRADSGGAPSAKKPQAPVSKNAEASTPASPNNPDQLKTSVTENIEPKQAQVVVPPKASVQAADETVSEASVQNQTETVQSIGKTQRAAEKSEGPFLLADLNPQSWVTRFNDFGLTGLIRTIACHCNLMSCEQGTLDLLLDENNSSLYNDSYPDKIADKLSTFFSAQINVTIRIGQIQQETPAAYQERCKAERQAEAVQAINDDPNVQLLAREFNAVIDETSIVPIDV